jgi:hypothetical protein
LEPAESPLPPAPVPADLGLKPQPVKATAVMIAIADVCLTCMLLLRAVLVVTRKFPGTARFPKKNDPPSYTFLAPQRAAAAAEPIVALKSGELAC